MSRNDLILVVRHTGNFYVLHDSINADLHWNTAYVLEAIKSSKSTRNRGKALIIAHDIQLKRDTEYGVQEMNLDHILRDSARAGYDSSGYESEA